MTRRVPITRTVFLLIALTLGAAVMIAPFLYMLSTSLKGKFTFWMFRRNLSPNNPPCKITLTPGKATTLLCILQTA